MTDKRKFPKTERHLYKQDAFDYDSFGLKVKSMRVLEGLRQDDLCSQIGCVRSTISKVERGMAINPMYMLRLCMRFQINILDYCKPEEINPIDEDIATDEYELQMLSL